MSIGKKIAHKAEAAKGAAKKYFGRATGNTRLAPRDASISSRATPNRPGTRSKTPSNTDPPAQSHLHRNKVNAMIILGIILLIAGFVLKISILWTIGIILLVIGVVLMLMGRMGRAVGGRRHYY